MLDYVTGATGFLGGHLVEALVRRGRRVRALVRPGSPRGELMRLGVQCVEAPLADANAVEPGLRDVDTVYHCAAKVDDWGPWQSFHEVNVRGTAALARAAARAGVRRFVHVSTTDVYGHPDREVDEDAPLRPRGMPYVDTKIQGEEALRRAADELGLSFTIVRPASIIGPRSRTFVTGVLERLRRRALVLVGPPFRPAGFAYVDNVVDALLLAARCERAAGRAYNVHDDVPATWRDYCGILARSLGCPPPRWAVPRPLAYAAASASELCWRVLRRPGHPPITRLAVELVGTTQRFAVERARQELGLRPAVDFHEAMRRIVSWAVEARI